jgi:ParB family chromosome partitioning protein
VGRRRLAACVALGWETIPARLIDIDDPLPLEVDENVQRKPFTPSEAVEIAEVIEERAKEQAHKRKQEGWMKRGKTVEPSDESSEDTKPQSRDVAAAAVGIGGKTDQRAKAVVDAARKLPDEWTELGERKTLQMNHLKCYSKRGGRDWGGD